jgi:phosphatidylglycerol---prolipoprotein diacylglyceryl transferase
MRPVLFRWRNFTVWSYPAMIYFGLLAAVVTGNYVARASGLDAFRVYLALLILAAPALLGARLFYVATHWERYRANPREIWARDQGGAAQYGGFLLALPLSVPLLAALRVPLAPFWDVAAFSILVLMIFGRAGCLLHGCCAGRPSHSIFSLNLPNSCGLWARRLPTQIFEGAWGAALLVFALVVRNSAPFPGALFLFVAGGYACGRLWLESTRERPVGARRLTIHLAISALIILSAVATLAARWHY